MYIMDILGDKIWELGQKRVNCQGWRISYGGFHSHGGTPSHHPFDWVFHHRQETSIEIAYRNCPSPVASMDSTTVPPLYHHDQAAGIEKSFCAKLCTSGLDHWYLQTYRKTFTSGAWAPGFCEWLGLHFVLKNGERTGKIGPKSEWTSTRLVSVDPHPAKICYES